MKGNKLPGPLMPSHPDAIPIINHSRNKCAIEKINPDDDPIEKMYLDDEIVPLKDFRQEILGEYRHSAFCCEELWIL